MSCAKFVLYSYYLCINVYYSHVKTNQIFFNYGEISSSFISCCEIRRHLTMVMWKKMSAKNQNRSSLHCLKQA